MGALIKACKKDLTIKNTGSECNDSMGPTAMILAVPPGTTFTDTDLQDFTTWLTTKIHADKGSRIYPLFGPGIPIRKITSQKESDVVPVQDDGTPIFVRYGATTKVYATTEGGICFAQALQSLNKAGYDIIEVDNANQCLIRNNADGTHGALKTTFMYAPSPDASDFKNPGYTNFQISYRPEEYVGNGNILQADDASILDLVGLLDVDLFIPPSTPSSTTKLKFGVETECAGTDLVAKLGTALAVISNFIVKLKSSGVVQTITAAAVVGGHIELTGTFTSAGVYTVELVPPATLLIANVEGYEGLAPLTITIP